MSGTSALIGPEALANLGKLAQAIPDVGDVFGFECRLRDEDTTVDLGIGIRRRVLRHVTSSARGRAAYAGTWDRLASFLDAWSDPRASLHAWVPFIFLEIDAEEAAEQMPRCSVFVSLDEPFTAGSETNDRGWTIAQLALELLHVEVLEQIRARVRDCFRLLPPDGHVLHVGAMLGRVAPTIRMSVAVPVADVGNYLPAIGFTTGPATVQRILRMIRASMQRVHLEFDVGQAFGPRVGVALAPDGPAEWTQLFDQLVDHRLCAPAKRDALLAWPTLPDADATPEIRRSLSHVKISAAPETALQAKA